MGVEVQVIEGESYTIRLTITNQATKGGVPVEVNLEVGISATVDSLTLISERVSSKHFNANETRIFSYTMVIPSGSGGKSGTITAWIEDPTGRSLAQGTAAVLVEEAPPPEPEPTDEELIYANWLRTGGTGSISYWRSIGSPLYYTPEPEPEPEPEPVCSHHYRVTYLDGSSGIISWKSDPISKPSLWDFVDRNDLLSWTYLGCY